jgi:serine/threonine protein kinase
LAKIAQSSVHTQVGSFLGSPAYMSPEQAQGKVANAYSDIYALGVKYQDIDDPSLMVKSVRTSMTRAKF